MKYYKFLDKLFEGTHTSFSYLPYLPKGNEPGEWLPEIEGELEMCENGYHVCRAKNIVYWLDSYLYEVECEDIIEADDKIVCRRMRLLRKIDAWNEKSQRLFACWCVRQVWDLLTDERSRQAVIVAERYANGEATEEELAAAMDAARAAAMAAARDAAIDAAWDAARDAARAAARDAARAAAMDAAGDAARDAAWDAAWDAARDAQNSHLIEVLELEE